MILRKLEVREHGRTRPLWEEVFPEDTPKFLDYYYSVKAAENEIYVIEEDNKIVSMLHLNPYRMRVGETLCQVHYIVGVATGKDYRGRGYMTMLLKHALDVMAKRGETFTFLMPAAEAIYRPFGFEWIYEQKRGTVYGRPGQHGGASFLLAKQEDCSRIAEFANAFLKKYDVVTWRDASYYASLLGEAESENGGILLAQKDGHLVGVFCFMRDSDGQSVEIREPLTDTDGLLLAAAFYLTGGASKGVSCIGYGAETKPMIMAKTLLPEWERDLRQMRVFLNEEV